MTLSVQVGRDVLDGARLDGPRFAGSEVSATRRT